METTDTTEQNELNEPVETAPIYRWVISENWLTRKPDPNALLIALFSVLLVVFGSYGYWGDFWNLNELLPATHQSVFTQHQYWRAWTTLIVHGDMKHLLGNLFLFTIFGYLLAGYFSLFFFPLWAFAFGGLTNFIVLWKMSPLIQLIGLSGVVFWMGGAWLILYFLIETRRTLWQKALRTVGVALVLFMPSEAFDASVSYSSHFVGFTLGVLAGLIYYFSHQNAIKAAEVSQLEIVS